MVLRFVLLLLGLYSSCCSECCFPLVYLWFSGYDCCGFGGWVRLGGGYCLCVACLLLSVLMLRNVWYLL